MNTRWIILLLGIMLIFVLGLSGCNEPVPDKKDTNLVEEQTIQYQLGQPLPIRDYSIPRDIFIQIYDGVTTKTYPTYTVIESITGEVKHRGHSIGYSIPADSQLATGLFSSNNANGTWVLFVQFDGQVVPVYTEHIVTTFPYPVQLTENGWVRGSGTTTNFSIHLNQ